MNTEPHSQNCPTCNGTGKVVDPVWLGEHLRQTRKDVGLSLTEVAARMGLSVPYVCELELGRRKWRQELVDRYADALGYHG